MVKLSKRERGERLPSNFRANTGSSDGKIVTLIRHIVRILTWTWTIQSMSILRVDCLTGVLRCRSSAGRASWVSRVWTGERKEKG